MNCHHPRPVLPEFKFTIFEIYVDHSRFFTDGTEKRELTR